MAICGYVLAHARTEDDERWRLWWCGQLVGLAMVGRRLERTHEAQIERGEACVHKQEQMILDESALLAESLQDARDILVGEHLELVEQVER